VEKHKEKVKTKTGGKEKGRFKAVGEKAFGVARQTQEILGPGKTAKGRSA